MLLKKCKLCHYQGASASFSVIFYKNQSSGFPRELAVLSLYLHITMKEHIFQPPQELFQSPQELCPRLPHALPSSSVLPADTSSHSQASLQAVRSRSSRLAEGCTGSGPGSPLPWIMSVAVPGPASFQDTECRMPTLDMGEVTFK